METFDDRKFRELVLYIADRCNTDSWYGKTKLYKTLFYSDFGMYEKTRRSITGTRYLAWEHGPVPESQERGYIERIMIEDGELALQKKGEQRRYIPLREPDLSVFTAEEIAVVDEAIERLKDDTAVAASARSHRDSLGWKAAYAEHNATNRQVVIPYDTVFVSNRKLDEFEEAHGLALAEKYGWPV